MKPTVYIETTIPSYLAARPSRDLVFAANQQLTRDWWDGQRARFDVYISQFVLDESAAGDADAAARRLDILCGVPILEASDDCRQLAGEFANKLALPPRAVTDALHLAVASLNGMEYLLTWNCVHLANAALRARIESVCAAAGLDAPIICTPPELMLE